MSARAMVFGIAVATAVSLAGCGEKPQTLEGSAKKYQSEPWAVHSAANPGYAASGWKAGDKASWEAQIRQRNQSQNDYAPR